MLKGYEHTEGFMICEDCSEDILEIHELKETNKKGKCIDCQKEIN